MVIGANIGQNLQPFTGIGEVSIWLKILEWDGNLQTNKQTKIFIDKIHFG